MLQVIPPESQVAPVCLSVHNISREFVTIITVRYRDSAKCHFKAFWHLNSWQQGGVRKVWRGSLVAESFRGGGWNRMNIPQMRMLGRLSRKLLSHRSNACQIHAETTSSSSSTRYSTNYQSQFFEPATNSDIFSFETRDVFKVMNNSPLKL